MTNICKFNYNKCHHECCHNGINYYMTLKTISSVVTPTHPSEEENEEQTYHDDPN